MDGQNLEKPVGQPVGELEPMRPEELLGNIADIGKSFRDYALKLQIMLEVAKEREISVDLSGNQTLKDFEVPNGKEENELRRIQQKLASVMTDIADQGVLITEKEMLVRLKEKPL